MITCLTELKHNTKREKIKEKITQNNAKIKKKIKNERYMIQMS